MVNRFEFGCEQWEQIQLSTDSERDSVLLALSLGGWIYIAGLTG